MSLRALLILLFSGTLVVVAAFLLLDGWLFESQFGLLFPPDLALELHTGLRTLLIEQGVTLFLLAVFILFLLYLILTGIIVRPLRMIANAMLSFAQDGKRVSLERIPKTPREFAQLAGVFSDFSERMEKSHKKDVDISRVKSDFISTAAHQLRTPLTGIRWALEALEKQEITPDQRALVTSAIDKSRDLVSIVGTLLDISSIESGKYKYTFAPTNILVLTNEVVRDFAPLAQEGGVSLSYQPGEESLPQARADKDRIKWVLNNLVENAIRYTPAGGSVWVTTDSSPERVYVRVHDTGIGIEPEDRSNIFERFYRTQNAITHNNQGNGLGLYIARTIATDHGGDLDFAENENGVGTTFILSLPVAN